MSSMVRARAIDSWSLSLTSSSSADQPALGVDQVVLGPVGLDLALGRLDAGAQLVEPRRQLVGGAAGGAGLHLAIGVEEDVGRRCWRSSADFSGLVGGRARSTTTKVLPPRSTDRLRARLRSGQLAPRLSASRGAGTRQDGAQLGDRG